MLIVGDRELLADVARRWKSNKRGMPLRANPPPIPISNWPPEILSNRPALALTNGH